MQEAQQTTRYNRYNMVWSVGLKHRSPTYGTPHSGAGM